MEKNFLAEILKIDDTKSAEEELRGIGADERGVAILREKAVFRTVKLKDVPLKAAILLKQTFLAKGGDAAVSRGVAGLTAETTDMVLMGTLKEYRQAIAVLKAQPFGLKGIAEEVEKLLFD